MQGFTDLVGHPSGGRRCLGEVGSRSGRHCVRRVLLSQRGIGCEEGS